MRVDIVNFTGDPLFTTYLACKTCTSTTDELHKIFPQPLRLKKEKMETLVASVIASGHESVLEHCSATFLVEGISRVCSHQLVRHRLASYSQQSQRYVKMDGTPEYHRLIDLGTPQEDARYCLPEGTFTNIVITMNARSLLHFFELRCCSKAQWEIRELAEDMLKICKRWFPIAFEKAGAKCTRCGYCTEAKSCGKAPQLKTLLEKYEECKELKNDLTEVRKRSK